jgi:CBS domain containing-hemolysin-like protein
MELPASIGLLAVVFLVLTNGFFVATEFALVAVRRSRLEQMAREGNASATRALEIVSHLDAYIAACQLGITMASLALGWVGEPALAHLIEPPLVYGMGRFAPAAAHGIAIAVSFAIITTLHIVLGELAPKGLALQRPDGTTLWVARPIQLFHRVFRWPINLMNAVGNAVLGAIGLRPSTGHEMVHSVDELQILVDVSQRAGTMEPSEARIAARAFEFADLTAGALVTPRTELQAVPVTASFDECIERAGSARRRRLIVYDGSLDDIVGTLYVHDLLRFCRVPGSFALRGLVRPVLTVPASKPADDLLDEMRAARQHLALVIDEYGGTLGIVTLEDLMEGLVGPIPEERGSVATGAVELAATAPDGSRVLDGLTRLRDFEEITGISLEEADHDAADTLGGLVMTRLDRLPDVGDEVRLGDRTLRVEGMDGRRVAAVRISPARQSPSGPSTE